MRMTMGKATAMLTIMATIMVTLTMATQMCRHGTGTPTQPARLGGTAA